MVQTFFMRSFTIHRLRQGPLAGHIDLLAARLATDGYSRVHGRIQLRLVGHFNRWLEQKHLTAKQLDEDVIERYRRYLKRRKRVRSEDVCTLLRLLDLLREQGVTPRRNIEGHRPRGSYCLRSTGDICSRSVALPRPHSATC